MSQCLQPETMFCHHNSKTNLLQGLKKMPQMMLYDHKVQEPATASMISMMLYDHKLHATDDMMFM